MAAPALSLQLVAQPGKFDSMLKTTARWFSNTAGWRLEPTPERDTLRVVSPTDISQPDAAKAVSELNAKVSGHVTDETQRGIQRILAWLAPIE